MRTRSLSLILAGVTVVLSSRPLGAGPRRVHEDDRSGRSPETTAGAPEPTLSGLVAEALAHAPTVTAIEARFTAATERGRAAAALPNPMVEVMADLPGFPRWTVGEEDMAKLGVTVRQGLLFPGKRRAARASAQAEAEVVAAELVRARRRLAREVAVLYARLYAIDREHALLAIAADVLDLLAGTTSARYAAGTAELAPMVKAELRRLRLEQRRDEVVAERRAINAALDRWLGRHDEVPLPTLTAIADPELTPGWEELAPERAPDVVVAQAMLAAAARKRGEAELARRPNLAAIAGYANRGSLDAVVTLGLEVELPLRRTRREEPLLRAAVLDLRAAELELEDARSTARAAATTLAAEWSRSDAIVRRDRQAVLPQSELLRDASRASYEAGKAAFSDVLEDFDLWLETQVEIARHEATRLATWAAVQELVEVQP